MRRFASCDECGQTSKSSAPVFGTRVRRGIERRKEGFVEEDEEEEDWKRPCTFTMQKRTGVPIRLIERGV